jgi:superfamily I DNA/RNA helicase
MHSLIMPKFTTQRLLGSAPIRHAVAAYILTAETFEPMVLGPRDDRFVVTLSEIVEGVYLLLPWNASDPQKLELRDQPLVSIWGEPDQSTLWSLPQEELADALERVCQLAERVWEGKPLPHHWTPKKLSGHQSIFAGDLRLKHLRIAYAVGSLGARRLLNVGSLFYAYRQEKLIQVPAVDSSVIVAIPVAVDRPAIPEFSSPQTKTSQEEQSPTDFDVIIDAPEGENRHLFSMKYGDWLNDNSPLTQQQRRVIKHKVARPLRIHGPAGSGKTLVLILKALFLVQAAQKDNSRCKILFVLNSNPVRDTVRNAIAAIDEVGFLATTKADQQFLDVETLHGWCIRELGLDLGPNYVLHLDPIVSKEKQDSLLAEILQRTIESKLPKMKSLLSPDLQAHFEGPGDQLIRNIRYEIAIRIKGRGLRKERNLYVKNAIPSFVGRKENRYDRFLLFDIFAEYEEALQEQGFLDTDDIVLSMQSRLAAPLWDRQRKSDGYDYVLVDETHLFNENERRVLPYLTRNIGDYISIVMSFDEGQSIGGRRPVELEQIGIRNSEKRTLSYVHRSSPDIFRLARDLVERSSLVFSEFDSIEAVPRMSDQDMKRCDKPELFYGADDNQVAIQVGQVASGLRSRNYARVGIVSFDIELMRLIAEKFNATLGQIHLVKERGELVAAVPNPGIYLMTPETCGGLEFDAVVLAGVDEGRVPPSMIGLSPEGHMSVREESFKELYTAITRARYRVCFLCNRGRGLSSLVKPCLDAGYILERKKNWADVSIN